MWVVAHEGSRAIELLLVLSLFHTHLFLHVLVQEDVFLALGITTNGHDCMDV